MKNGNLFLDELFGKDIDKHFSDLFKNDIELQKILFRQYLITELQPNRHLFFNDHISKTEWEKCVEEMQGSLPIKGAKNVIAGFSIKPECEKKADEVIRKFHELSQKKLPEKYFSHSIAQTEIYKILMDLFIRIDDFKIRVLKPNHFDTKEHAEAFAKSVIELLEAINIPKLTKNVLADFIGNQENLLIETELIFDNEYHFQKKYGINYTDAKYNYRELKTYADNYINDYLKKFEEKIQLNKPEEILPENLIKPGKQAISKNPQLLDYLLNKQIPITSRLDEYNKYDNLAFITSPSMLYPHFDKLVCGNKNYIKAFWTEKQKAIKAIQEKQSTLNYEVFVRYMFNEIGEFKNKQIIHGTKENDWKETIIYDITPKDEVQAEILERVSMEYSKANAETFFKKPSRMGENILHLPFILFESLKKDFKESMNKPYADYVLVIADYKKQYLEPLQDTETQSTAQTIYRNFKTGKTDNYKGKDYFYYTTKGAVIELLKFEKYLEKIEVLEEENHKAKAVFNFIEFLHSNIDKFKSYIPTAEKALSISREMSQLKPNENFADKIKYNELNELKNKEFDKVFKNVTQIIINKALELNICTKTNGVIKLNWDVNTFQKFKDHATHNDLPLINKIKDKYLEFKLHTDNSGFLSLGLFFFDLHRELKELFIFYNQNAKAEFEEIENRKIPVPKPFNSLSEEQQNLKIANDLLGDNDSRTTSIVYHHIPRVLEKYGLNSLQAKNILLTMRGAFSPNSNKFIIPKIIDYLIEIDFKSEISLGQSNNKSPQTASKLILFNSQKTITKLHSELKGYFPGREKELLRALNGEKLNNFILFPHNQNRFVEVFKRAKYNYLILSNATEIKNWLCSNFVRLAKGNEKEFNENSVWDILTKDKGEPTKKHRICIVDWMPYKTYNERQN